MRYGSAVWDLSHRWKRRKVWRSRFGLGGESDESGEMRWRRDEIL